MANGHIQVNDKQQIDVEEIFFSMIMYLVKKPKGLLILGGLIAVFVAVLYFSFIRAQNSMLIDSLKVLQSTAQISETITKKVKEIEIKADEASKNIDERIKRLDEVEARFQAKREEIQKLRKEQDDLMKKLEDKVNLANEKLGQIEIQQTKTKDTLKKIEVEQSKIR